MKLDMVRRDFSFGRLNKATSSILHAPGPAAVAVPVPMQTCWQRTNPRASVATAPTTDTSGSTLNFVATNPDPRSPRSWTESLATWLRGLAGCE
jgi:hypothetical protein